MNKLSREFWAILAVDVALGLLLSHMAGGLRGEVAQVRVEVAGVRLDVCIGNKGTPGA